MIRILGIDPGFGRVGYGVIEGDKADWKHVAHGCLETAANDPFVNRLVSIYDAIGKLVHDYRPTIAGVEELFFYKNVKTALAVGQARGVILLALARAQLQIVECTPLEVKQAITGYGQAEKRQVQVMLQTLLHLPKKPIQDDAADALAVALTAGLIRPRL